MSEEQKVFFEIHRGLPQQGPGSDESTLKALKAIENLPDEVKVLDIGCGPGRQTVALASTLRGEVIAIDTYQEFLLELAERSKKAPLTSTVKAANVSMHQLPFKAGEFDVIWSEGAAYILGVQRALQEWARFLKPSGHIAITELCWTKDPQKNEAWQFFRKGIRT